MHMWSDTKKKLESFLCDSLKGRIEYYCTMYREADDGLGRACILVDKTVVLNCSALEFDHKLSNEKRYRREGKGRPVYKIREFKYWTLEDTQTGGKVYSTEAFFEAVGFLFDNPISASLNHFNDIVVCLALADRRTGKRTLKKLKDDIAEKSNLVKFFYELRCNAEFKDISINS